MNERLKEIRRALGLTQAEFADKVGIKRNTLATYESGRNVPIDPIIKLICREAKVNESWLRTGEGEMFIDESDIMDKLAKEYDLTPADVAIVERYMTFPPAIRKVILSYIMELAESLRQIDSGSPPAETGESAYEKNVLNAQSTGSSASNTTGSIRSPDELEA